MTGVPEKPGLGFPGWDDVRCRRFRRSLRPHPPFFNSCCKQSTSSIRRLGGPCVTLGWPLGHPWVTQGPPKPNPKPKHRQRVATFEAARRNTGAPVEPGFGLAGWNNRRDSNCHRSCRWPKARALSAVEGERRNRGPRQARFRLLG